VEKVEVMVGLGAVSEVGREGKDGAAESGFSMLSD